jgi:hypothetical protein
MPFILYDVKRTETAREYTYRHEVKVGGKAGPLAAMERKQNTAGAVPFRWHVTASDVVALVGDSGGDQDLIIDLKPKVANNVSLYRLVDIWGFSYSDWTPIALRLEGLFSDLSHDDPRKFKDHFTDERAGRSFVGEFLYLQGGVNGGSWSWGRVGSVNGALLWRDAFEYLTDELRSGLAAQS